MSHVRHCSSHLLRGDPVATVQEVYGKLEEPDGLGGLVRLRRGGPRPQDQVLAAEKEGGLVRGAVPVRAGAAKRPAQWLARLQTCPGSAKHGCGNCTRLSCTCQGACPLLVLGAALDAASVGRLPSVRLCSHASSITEASAEQLGQHEAQMR